MKTILRYADGLLPDAAMRTGPGGPVKGAPAVRAVDLYPGRNEDRPRRAGEVHLNWSFHLTRLEECDS